MPSLIVRPEAEKDIADAYGWYEYHRRGLGDEFLLRVEAALESIHHSPQLCAKIHKDIRRKLMRRFPYGIFYIIGQETISVLAVVHAKQHPGRWQNRIQLDC